MKILLSAGACTAALVMAAAAQAATPVVDGIISPGEYANAIETHVYYDPSSPTDFSTFPTTTELAAYNVWFESTAGRVYVAIQSDPAGAGNDMFDQSLGTVFANLYFGTAGAANGATVGIEAENDRAFIPGGNGTYFPLSSVGAQYAQTIGTPYASGASPSVIEFSIPDSFFETDPLGMGFATVQPGGQLQLRDCQCLGYAPATSGDPDRFGFVTLAALPEPATWATMLVGFGGIGAAMRRARRKQAAALA